MLSAVEKLRLVDDEIQFLKGQLCGLIDAELEVLGGNAGGEQETLDVRMRRLAVDALCKNVRHYLTRGNALSYTKRNFSTRYFLLQNERGSLIEQEIERLILDSDLLESRINFLNRLKLSGLIGLNPEAENLLPLPVDKRSLRLFVQMCGKWIELWDPKLSGDQAFYALSREQKSNFFFFSSFLEWIPLNQMSALGQCQFDDARRFLSEHYEKNMSEFEKLRPKLDHIELSRSK